MALYTLSNDLLVFRPKTFFLKHILYFSLSHLSISMVCLFGYTFFRCFLSTLCPIFVSFDFIHMQIYCLMSHKRMYDRSTCEKFWSLFKFVFLLGIDWVVNYKTRFWHIISCVIHVCCFFSFLLVVFFSEWKKVSRVISTYFFFLSFLYFQDSFHILHAIDTANLQEVYAYWTTKNVNS